MHGLLRLEYLYCDPTFTAPLIVLIFFSAEEYIPRGRDLVFEVTMWNVVPNYMIGMPNMFKVYDKDKDGYITKHEVCLQSD